MGTGSLAVTISGISAANMVLRNMGEKEYRGSSALTDVVREYQGKVDTLPGNGRNWQPPSINAIDDTQLRELHDSASTCQWCLDAPCRNVCPHHYDIPAIMRRLECGNLVGARLQILGSVACAACPAPCKDSCRAKTIHDNPVAIDSILLTMGQLSEQRR